MILDKQLFASEPWFTFLQIGDNNSTYLMAVRSLKWVHSAQKMETTNFKWYFDASLLILNELDFMLVIDNLQHTGGKVALFKVVGLFADKILFISITIKITPKDCSLVVGYCEKNRDRKLSKLHFHAFLNNCVI